MKKIHKQFSSTVQGLEENENLFWIILIISTNLKLCLANAIHNFR